MGLEAFLFYGYPYDLALQKELETARRMDAVRERWRQRRAQQEAVKPLEERVASLEKDLGYVTLVLGAVLDRLDVNFLRELKS
jgi:hypothetical protein